MAIDLKRIATAHGTTYRLRHKKSTEAAADFLDEKLESLMSALDEQPQEQQMRIRSGMADTLLRNIFLHRDEII